LISPSSPATRNASSWTPTATSDFEPTGSTSTGSNARSSPTGATWEPVRGRDAEQVRGVSPRKDRRVAGGLAGDHVERADLVGRQRHPDDAALGGDVRVGAARRPGVHALLLDRDVVFGGCHYRAFGRGSHKPRAARRRGEPARQFTPSDAH